MKNHKKSIWRTLWDSRIKTLIALSFITSLVSIIGAASGFILWLTWDGLDESLSGMGLDEPTTGIGVLLSASFGLIFLIYSLNAFFAGFDLIRNNYRKKSVWQTLYTADLSAFCFFSVIIAVIMALSIIFSFYGYVNNEAVIQSTDPEVVTASAFFSIFLFYLMLLLHSLNSLFIGFYELHRKKVPNTSKSKK